jgi:T4 RnlA family RNA ligase
MLEVQRFLNTACQDRGVAGVKRKLESLKSEHGIKYSIWEDTLVVLNYCQIDSKKTDPIAQECRSLVLEMGTWEIVSRSFNRFFNYGEEPCPKVGIEHMIAYEKVDGSLIGLFNYKGEWMYRTRSVIMPESNINGWEVTWKDHIEEALSGMEMAALNEQVTYIMELTSPENRVVTKYAGVEPVLTLLAIRYNESGNYVNDNRVLQVTRYHGLRMVHSFKFETISDCLEAAKELRELQEGYVLYNRQGEPVCKVKNPAYVAAHHLRGEGLNPKRIKDLIIMNETDEYLAIFPEDAKMFTPYQRAMVRLLIGIAEACDLVHDKTLTQKDFALKIKDLPYKGILFSMRSGMAITAAWDKCTTNTKYQLIDGMMGKGED